MLRAHPERLIRNVHQVFHDMVRTYVGEGYDEYPDDPESINFVSYDCRRLFVDNTDQPFFADRIFANRLMNMIDAFRGGAQQNKIFIFDGPPGCGKSHLPEQPAAALRGVRRPARPGCATRWSGAWTANCWASTGARRPARARAPGRACWTAAAMRAACGRSADAHRFAPAAELRRGALPQPRQPDPDGAQGPAARLLRRAVRERRVQVEPVVRQGIRLGLPRRALHHLRLAVPGAAAQAGTTRTRSSG